MEVIYLKIAEVVIQINLHPSEGAYYYNKLKNEILIQYKAFVTSPKIKFQFQIDFFDFYQNKNKEIYTRRSGSTYDIYVDFCKILNGRRVISYYKISIAQFQFILSNIIQKYLTANNGFILHASGVSYKNKAHLFIGKSGSGKSTLINLLKDTYVRIADDSAIIKRADNIHFFHQTPFIEKNYWEKKRMGPLQIRGVYLLIKSSRYAVERIDNTSFIFSHLSEQLVLHEKKAPSQIKHLLQFIQMNKFYFLYFGKNKSKVAELIKGV